VPRADADLTRIVTEFIDPDQFPALIAVHAAEHATHPADPDRTARGALPFELAFGVDRFLDGIDHWTATNNRRPADPAP
jgi:hypothetical protein